MKILKLEKLILSLLIIFSILYLNAGYVLCEAKNETSEKVINEVHRIVDNIKITKYQHKTEIDEAKGIYYADCSGFVAYVLDKVSPKQIESIRKNMNVRRLRAIDFYQYFEKIKNGSIKDSGWEMVDSVKDIKPGDIIVWKAENPKPGNTGHIVFADSFSSETKTSINSDEGRTEKKLYYVSIIDSTSTGSKTFSSEIGETGIGLRDMWLLPNDKNEIVGFKRHSVNKKTQYISVLVARLKD